MTSEDAARRRWRAVWILGIALALTVAVVILQLPGSDVRRHQSTEGPTIPPTPAPTATVGCTEDPGDLAIDLRRAACPDAILAVELAVAPVRLPIDRIVIQPGPLFCDLLWPGVQTARPGCRGGGYVPPGQVMHAWVRFRSSPKVAVVVLGLDLPDFTRSPRPTRPPWSTTLVALEIPPTGWVMP